jgi:hypothetical protein
VKSIIRRTPALRISCRIDKRTISGVAVCVICNLWIACNPSHELVPRNVLPKQEVTLDKIRGTEKIGAVAITWPSWDHKIKFNEMSFITSDLGRTWNHVEKSIFLQNPMQLGAHPAESQTAYRIGGELFVVLFMESSSDGGKSWKKLKAHIQGTSNDLKNYSFLAFHPTSPSTIFVAGKVLGASPDNTPENLGLYVSHDRGATFTLLVSGVDPFTFAISLANPDLLYCTLFRQYLIKSEDSGKSWELVGPFGENEQRQHGERWISRIIIHPRNDKLAYAETTEGIWKTSDNGQHWSFLRPAIWKTAQITSVVLAVNNAEDALMVGTNMGLFVSRDGGTTWSQIILK